MLPKSGSSSPGPWRTDRTPYLKGVMDELSASCPTREIVFAKGSQIGASEAGTNWLMYLIDQQPGPLLALQPTEQTAMRWSKQRIGPSLLQCEQLSDKLFRNNGNTLLQKDFINGTLILSGANSPASLASMPISAIYFDEIDRYPDSAGDEGDPIGLALRRTATFQNAKIFYSSTPTLLNLSRTWDLWEDSDQRYYHVPCPHCGEKQVLYFENLLWDRGDPDSVVLVCIHCGSLIEEHYKRRAGGV
ncbi:phage terminase large subunit family protein [Providencia manganoxydans]|uniref:phage terminase large subunit family protein n=1 Tax=Providencia manganoxydans TaxID=2923283 RepID=UPI003AF363AC